MLSKYERDVLCIKVDVLKRIAEYFNVTTDYLPVSYTHLDVYKRQQDRQNRKHRDAEKENRNYDEKI